MNRQKMIIASISAHKFIEACKDVDKRYYKNDLIDLFAGSKETGNLRRASLMLSRDLAELRSAKHKP